MPVGTLPGKAKEIYEKVYQETLERLRSEAGEGADEDSLKERASKIAWGAVKNAGYRKSSDSDTWKKMLEPMFAVFGEELQADGEWVEIACTGDVVDMNGRGISIEEEDLDTWIQAYEEDARGQELPITYDHPRRGGVAAGWFRGLRKGEPRAFRGQKRIPLLMKPEWTPKGKQSIQEGDYRYFSLEITPDNVLRGGSLVNFPAIKGLQPLNQVAMSEGFYLKEFLMAETTKCPECGAPVPEGADACPSCGAEITEEEETKMADNEQLTSLSEQLNAATKELEKLRNVRQLHEELKDTVSKQETKLTEQERQITGLLELNNMLRLHERVTEFMQLAEHDRRIISPAYEEQIIGFMLQLENSDEEENFLKLLEAIAAGDAVVELGERGTSEGPKPKPEGKTSAQELHEAAIKLMEEREIPYRDALISVSREVRND